jgi:hypothetical protein
MTGLRASLTTVSMPRYVVEGRSAIGKALFHREPLNVIFPKHLFNHGSKSLPLSVFVIRLPAMKLSVNQHRLHFLGAYLGF